MDLKVLQAQRWYNDTYAGTSGYVEIAEDGITGTGTCKAFVRALQYELGLDVDGSFGKGTLSSCPTIGSGSDPSLIKIIQCGFYCKGYECGGIDGIYGASAQSAAKTFKEDAGFEDEDGNMQPVFIQALLNTDAFKLVNQGISYVREAQQYLNRNYVRKTGIIGLIACNGIPDRNMSKAVIIALQYEEAGKTMNGVDGIYGNNTLNKAPELALGSTKEEYVRIAQMCMMLMYNNRYVSGVYDSFFENTVKSFQEFYCLTQDPGVVPGVIGRITWASLLSSKGDTSRTATACDCSERILSDAKAQKLKETYDIVGRYLTGTVGGSKPKNLTILEIKILARNGLRIFPIYQDGGASPDYFCNEQGIKDAEKAIEAAKNLHIPDNTIIYFAVDYDYTQDQVISKVIPHFQGIKSVFDASSVANYRIGIYGARNTCTLVSEEGLAVSSFVSDMSTGYSGNLGYPLPDNWAFDQILEYTVQASDGTKFAVDKDVASGRDTGFFGGDLCGGEDETDYTKHAMTLREDGYYECPFCGKSVISPFVQDEQILSENDALKIKALTYMYGASMGDDTYRNILYAICLEMNRIRTKESYNGKYGYSDENGDCLLIPPEGLYNDTDFMVSAYEPEEITSQNITFYNGIFSTFVDSLYGLAVDAKYKLTLGEIIAKLLQGTDPPVISLCEILVELAETAGQTEFVIILNLLKLGIDINEAESKSEAEIGDIGVRVNLEYPNPNGREAVVIFNKEGKFKSVAF